MFGSRSVDSKVMGTAAWLFAPAPAVRVPFLGDDVHDLDGLAQVAGYMFAG